MHKQIEKLSPYTFNAKSWRIRNGFVSDEWEMYVKNVQISLYFAGFMGFIFGLIAMYLEMTYG